MRRPEKIYTDAGIFEKTVPDLSLFCGKYPEFPADVW